MEMSNADVQRIQLARRKLIKAMNSHAELVHDTVQSMRVCAVTMASDVMAATSEMYTSSDGSNDDDIDRVIHYVTSRVEAMEDLTLAFNAQAEAIMAMAKTITPQSINLKGE